MSTTYNIPENEIPMTIECPTPVKDELSRRVNLGGYDVPITIDARTSFEPRHHVSVNIGTAKEWTGEGDERRDVVSKVEITVHGVMTFKDRSDSAAAVHVTRTSSGKVYRHARSTAWDGRTFKEMPEGARKKVSAKIEEMLGDIDWQALSIETQMADRVRSFNGHVSEAANAVADARRELAAFTNPPLPLP